MEINDFAPYFDPVELKKKVLVRLKDGHVFVGVICGLYNDFETNSGKDEIEMVARKMYTEYSDEILDFHVTDGYDLVIEISDIESVELVTSIKPKRL